MYCGVFLFYLASLISHYDKLISHYDLTLICSCLPGTLGIGSQILDTRSLLQREAAPALLAKAACQGVQNEHFSSQLVDSYTDQCQAPQGEGSCLGQTQQGVLLDLDGHPVCGTSEQTESQWGLDLKGQDHDLAQDVNDTEECGTVSSGDQYTSSEDEQYSNGDEQYSSDEGYESVDDSEDQEEEGEEVESESDDGDSIGDDSKGSMCHIHSQQDTGEGDEEEDDDEEVDKAEEQRRLASSALVGDGYPNSEIETNRDDSTVQPEYCQPGEGFKREDMLVPRPILDLEQQLACVWEGAGQYED